MPGNIYIGYQGIGKSSLAGKNTGFIDLESSNFRLPGGYRPQEWYKYYVYCAYSIANQGYNVLLSSHDVVRKEVYEHRHYRESGYYYPTGNSHIKSFVIYPSLNLKEKWIKKLYDRFLAEDTRKNRVAYLNASDRYSDNILEIKEDALKYGFKEIEIQNMDYNLKELIDLEKL